jgi:hypothetical protein
VDPQDPGYAELPGDPYSSSAEWEIPLVIGLGCMVIFPIGVGVAWLERLRSRRRLVRTMLR